MVENIFREFINLPLKHEYVNSTRNTSVRNLANEGLLVTVENGFQPRAIYMEKRTTSLLNNEFAESKHSQVIKIFFHVGLVTATSQHKQFQSCSVYLNIIGYLLNRFTNVNRSFSGRVRNLWVNVVKRRNFGGIDNHINNSGTQLFFRRTLVKFWSCHKATSNNPLNIKILDSNAPLV
jgi:hypothetical protein